MPSVVDPDPNLDRLRAELAHHDLTLSERQLAQLDAYRQQLWSWNERLNLTRHLDLSTFVNRDVLDAYQLSTCLQAGETVLDIGTGGGVPGVLLSILRPELHVTLCEPVGKKAAAVAAMVQEVNLPIPVFEARVQDVLIDQAFQCLVARAVGPLWKMLTWVQPHWQQFERLIVIKGPKWIEERGEARHRGLLKGLDLRRLKSYPTPGHFGESVVLVIRQPETPHH